MASLLVVLAVLFGRTLVAIQSIPPGFDTRRLLTLRLALPVTRYGDGPQMTSFFDQTLERLRTLPGVTGVGATTRVPAAGSRFNPNRTVVIEGQAPPDGESIFANDLTISPGYLETLGVPVREGRGIARGDGAQAPLAVVINETMARRYWGTASPSARGSASATSLAVAGGRSLAWWGISATMMWTRRRSRMSSCP